MVADVWNIFLSVLGEFRVNIHVECLKHSKLETFKDVLMWQARLLFLMKTNQMIPFEKACILYPLRKMTDMTTDCSVTYSSSVEVFVLSE